jgi:hypothetical protein
VIKLVNIKIFVIDVIQKQENTNVQNSSKQNTRRNINYLKNIFEQQIEATYHRSDRLSSALWPR